MELSGIYFNIFKYFSDFNSFKKGQKVFNICLGPAKMTWRIEDTWHSHARPCGAYMAQGGLQASKWWARGLVGLGKLVGAY